MDSMTMYVKHGTSTVVQMDRDIHFFGKHTGDGVTNFTKFAVGTPDASHFVVPGRERCEQGTGSQCQNALGRRHHAIAVGKTKMCGTEPCEGKGVACCGSVGPSAGICINETTTTCCSNPDFPNLGSPCPRDGGECCNGGSCCPPGWHCEGAAGCRKS